MLVRLVGQIPGQASSLSQIDHPYLVKVVIFDLVFSIFEVVIFD